MSKIRGLAVVVVAVLTVAGCGSTASPAASPSPSATPAASTSPPAGSLAFLAIVRKSGLGDRDVQAASDRQLLRLAMIICDSFDEGLGYQDQIQIMQSIGHHVTTRQGAVWVDAAVRNLCPAHLGEIPAGAP